MRTPILKSLLIHRKQRANKPLAAIVPIKVYEKMLKQPEKDFSVLDRIWEKCQR